MKNIVKSSIKIAILTTSILCQSSFADDTIHKITVQGNNRVEISTIKNYLGFKVGDEYSLLKENEYVKNLYATSLFEKIDIKFLSGNLLVTVTETPFISKVDFKGNSKVRTAMLSKELETRSGDSLSLANIQIDIEKIKEIYKRSGRFSVSVTPKIEKQDNNRVKVIFEIMEGPKTGVKRIYFLFPLFFSISSYFYFLLFFFFLFIFFYFHPLFFFFLFIFFYFHPLFCFYVLLS